MSTRQAHADRSALHDDQIMAAVKAGSVTAFGVLYERYCDRVYRIARSVCRDDCHAQQAVQEAFISIWRTRATYPDCPTLATWILTVARNRAVDIARQHRPHHVDHGSDDRLDDLPNAGIAAEPLIADDQGHDILSALAQLPDAQQELITLALYGQLTHSEIAAHLKLPPDTIKRRMQLALNRLQRS